MIRLVQFCKTYGELTAVHPLDLQIEGGESFALIGPNGSGKSTIIRALAGLHAATSGEVQVDGVEVQSKAGRAAGRVAYMPQRMTAPPTLTIREVLAFFGGLKKVPVEAMAPMLDRVGLLDSADRPVRELSGGTVQRLGLAVLFLGEPQLLVMDEPTVNLDPGGILVFRRLVDEARKRGATMVLSSHILQDALELSDRVGVLIEGRMATVDTVNDFRKKVAMHTMLRVNLQKTHDGLAAAARNGGAHEVHVNGTEVAFKAAPEKRMQVIRAIEQAGGQVDSLLTEMPSWEMLIEHQLEETAR